MTFSITWLGIFHALGYITIIVVIWLGVGHYIAINKRKRLWVKIKLIKETEYIDDLLTLRKEFLDNDDFMLVKMVDDKLNMIQR